MGREMDRVRGEEGRNGGFGECGCELEGEMEILVSVAEKWRERWRYW